MINAHSHPSSGGNSTVVPNEFMWNSSLQHTAITRRDANLSACAQTCIDDSLGQYPCNSACGLLCVCEDIAAWPPITTCLLASCPTTDVASFRLAMSSCAVYIAGCPQGTSTAAVTFPMQGGSTPGTSASIGVTTTAATPAPTKTTSEVNQWSSPTDWRTSPPTPSSVSSTAINASTDMVLTITSAPTLPSTTILTSNDTTHEASSSNPVVISSATLGAALLLTLLLTLYLYVHRHHRQLDAQSITAQPLTITFTSDDVSRLRERERSWAESRDEGRNAFPRASVSSSYWTTSTVAPPRYTSDIVPSAVVASAGSLPPSYRAAMSAPSSRARLYDTLFSRDSVSLSPCHERRESSVTRDEPADHEDDGEPSSYYSTRTRPSTRLSEPHPTDAAPARQMDADVSPLDLVQESPPRQLLPGLMQESEAGHSELLPPYESSS